MVYKPRLSRKKPSLFDKDTALETRGRTRDRPDTEYPLMSDLEIVDMDDEEKVATKQDIFLDSIGVKADASEEEKVRAVRRYRVATMMMQGYTPEQITQKCGYTYLDVTNDIRFILKGWKDEFEQNRGTIRGKLSKKLEDDEAQIRMLLEYALGDFTDEQVEAAENAGRKPRKVSLGTWAQLYDRILKIYDFRSKLFQLDDEMLPAVGDGNTSRRQMVIFNFERLVPNQVPEGVSDGGKGEITAEEQELIELSYLSEEQRERRERLLAKKAQVEKAHSYKKEIEEQQKKLVRNWDEG
jgi:hypothetical protein